MKTIADTQTTTLAGTEPTGSTRALIAAGELTDFRCAMGRAEMLEDGTLALDAETAAALKLSPGDTLCWAPR